MSAIDQASLLDLFRQEVQTQSRTLTDGLLALERGGSVAAPLQECMRAAHSLKGAARIVGLDSVVEIAHAMEEAFVEAQQSRRHIGAMQVDVLLQGVDLLERVARLSEAESVAWADPSHGDAAVYVQKLQAALSADEPKLPAVAVAPEAVAHDPAETAASQGVLRLTAESVNRLMGLASESLVESRGLKPLGDGMLRLKRRLQETGRRVDDIRHAMGRPDFLDRLETLLAQVHGQLLHCQDSVVQQLALVDALDRRATDVARRLYDEAVACRMRPLADALHGLPRLVRDVGRAVGKQVRLEVSGEDTPVDRDVLERLEAPLIHLLRNAVDHGIEAPGQRLAAGKPQEGVVRLEARHVGGLLQISVSDDGAGIPLDKVSARIVARGLASQETAARLSDAELLEFLFLPGFSLRDVVTEISGRGVGLDIVQEMVRRVRGNVRISTERGWGTTFHLLLPLTLSVVRALLVEVSGEAYAFPLNRIVRTLRLATRELQQFEGRHHVALDGQQVSLVSARQLLGHGAEPAHGAELTVVVIGEFPRVCGLVVDRASDEKELVMQPLDERLGKVQHVTSGAVMDDGSVVLILDVEDLLRAVERMGSDGGLRRLHAADSAAKALQRKRVLVVDDSLAVRELERKLLESRGYRVDVAVDGMDGWNAARTQPFDLVITDVDMPRTDGIELVRMIRNDPHLKALPVMIVSYKDREADRRRGLEAGADHYLAKSGFHDEALLRAVVDLIGEATS